VFPATALIAIHVAFFGDRPGLACCVAVAGAELSALGVNCGKHLPLVFDASASSIRIEPWSRPETCGTGRPIWSGRRAASVSQERLAREYRNRRAITALVQYEIDTHRRRHHRRDDRAHAQDRRGDH
jgi:hypothetical protein